SYDWNSLIKAGRVKKVLNCVATSDWVVGYFPKAFEMVPIQDLGSAGHDGFTAATVTTNVIELSATNGAPVYVVGGHGAALNELMWDEFGRFLMSGKFATPQKLHVSPTQAAWVALPAKVAPALW